MADSLCTEVFVLCLAVYFVLFLVYSVQSLTFPSVSAHKTVPVELHCKTKRRMTTASEDNLTLIVVVHLWELVTPGCILWSAPQSSTAVILGKTVRTDKRIFYGQHRILQLK